MLIITPRNTTPRARILDPNGTDTGTPIPMNATEHTSVNWVFTASANGEYTFLFEALEDTVACRFFIYDVQITHVGQVLDCEGVQGFRYGFQGQEKDDEIKGEGNSVNYTYRMHDPRLGRFFAVDPLAYDYAYNSPYAFCENKVIDGIELEGLEHSEIIIHRTVTRQQVDDHERVTQTTVKYNKVYRPNLAGKSVLAYTIRITNESSIDVNRDGTESNPLSITRTAVISADGKSDGEPNAPQVQHKVDKKQMSKEFNKVLTESKTYNKKHKNTYFEDEAKKNETRSENYHSAIDYGSVVVGAAIVSKNRPSTLAVGIAIKLIGDVLKEGARTNHFFPTDPHSVRSLRTNAGKTRKTVSNDVVNTNGFHIYSTVTKGTD